MESQLEGSKVLVHLRRVGERPYSIFCDQPPHSFAALHERSKAFRQNHHCSVGQMSCNIPLMYQGGDLGIGDGEEDSIQDLRVVTIDQTNCEDKWLHIHIRDYFYWPSQIYFNELSIFIHSIFSFFCLHTFFTVNSISVYIFCSIVFFVSCSLKHHVVTATEHQS